MPADAVTDGASADSNHNPVSWSTVNQEYRSLLATTATFLQTHAFSDCRRQSDTSSSEEIADRVSIFKDENYDDSRVENDFSQAKSNHDNWSFSVTVEVPADGVNPDTEIPVSIFFLFMLVG